jgi:hypothetical protein
MPKLVVGQSCAPPRDWAGSDAYVDSGERSKITA